MRRWRTVCTHVNGKDSCDAINVCGWSTSSDNSLSVNLFSIGACYMMNQVSSVMIATFGFTMSTVCPNGACLNYRQDLGIRSSGIYHNGIYNSVSSDVRVLPCEQ